MPKGKIIVIEGGDSSGKEVQSRKLYRKLLKLGYPVRFLDFPRYDQFFGKLTGWYLRGEFGDVQEVSPFLASLPFALDRLKEKEKIKNWLEEGKIIICNRYVGSNLAYMSAKLPKRNRPDFIRWLEELEYKRFGLPREDVAIFLHVAPKVGQRLTYKKDKKVYMKGLGRGDIHERDLAYLEEVTHQFLWLSKNRKNRLTIECMEDGQNLLPADKIHQAVMQILKKRKIVQ